MDSTTVGAKSRIEKSIISHSVAIGEGCTISAGVVISHDVKVASGIKLPANVIIAASTDETPSNAALVGKSGRGYDYVDSESEDDSEDETSVGKRLDLGVKSLVGGLKSLDLSDSSLSTDSEEEGEETEDDDVTDEDRSDESITIESGDSRTNEDFHREAAASLERALNEDHPTEIAALELNTLRMASNARHDEVRKAIVVALLSHVIGMTSKNAKPNATKLNSFFGKWTALFDRVNHTTEDRAKTLVAFQSFFEISIDKGELINISLVGLILRVLYEVDVVEEDDILKWTENLKASSATPNDHSKGFAAILQIAQMFCKQLEDAEESDDS
jgi:translation initiation factor eIF-2B subunit epsilon